MKKPQFMLTYLCLNCNFDFAISDTDKPRCFYCDAKDGFKLLSREKITPEVIAARLKKVSDRLMDNLKSAYEAGKDDEDFDETMMLQVLDKASQLRKKTHSLKLKNKKNNK